jgi:hypothetical protein
MCFKAFSLEISRQCLHLRAVDNPVPIHLVDDERALSFYGILVDEPGLGKTATLLALICSAGMKPQIPGIS